MMLKLLTLKRCLGLRRHHHESCQGAWDSLELKVYSANRGRVCGVELWDRFEKANVVRLELKGIGLDLSRASTRSELRKEVALKPRQDNTPRPSQKSHDSAYIWFLGSK